MLLLIQAQNGSTQTYLSWLFQIFFKMSTFQWHQYDDPLLHAPSEDGHISTNWGTPLNLDAPPDSWVTLIQTTGNLSVSGSRPWNYGFACPPLDLMMDLMTINRLHTIPHHLIPWLSILLLPLIYKTKIHWNKGGIPLVLSVVQLVFLVYSPSSSLPDYQLCVTGPCIFTRVRFVCKGVPFKKDLFICKALYGWYLTSTILQRNCCTLCNIDSICKNKMVPVKT